MEAVSLLKLAVAKSGLPSPLMSPMLTEKGSAPVGKGTWVAKVGVPAPVGVVLSRMEALLLFKFATAESGFPSLLKSLMLMEVGSVPVGEGTWCVGGCGVRRGGWSWLCDCRGWRWWWGWGGGMAGGGG